MILGPDSSLAPLIAAAVLPLAGASTSRAMALGAMLAILAGPPLHPRRAGAFGYLTDLLSVPVRYGYLNGIALLIFVSQLPKLCGFSTDADGVVEGVEQFGAGSPMGRRTGPPLCSASAL